jgi:hypothetical protein
MLMSPHPGAELNELLWVKSSRSQNGGECVETARLTDVAWFKASHGQQDGNCIETARLTPGMAVRDSKNPDGPAHVFGSRAWVSFLTSVRGR